MPRKRANEIMGYGDDNPFEQSNNPFGGDNPFGDSGVTDDGVFAPEPVGDGTLPEQEPEPEPMTEAETTRPRQLPAKLIPIRCGACDRTFTMAKVSESLRCICGADALDLDLTAEANQYNTDVDSYRGGGSKTFLISWEMDGAFGQSAVKADRELDAIAWLRATMSIDKVIQVWELPEDVVASIVRQAMEGDPPLGEVVEGDQPLGLLPEPELFPQFTDDTNGAEGEDIDQVVSYIIRDNPDLTYRKAKWLALRARARYMGAGEK